MAYQSISYLIGKLLEVVQNAALESWKTAGSGNEIACDAVAVRAMRDTFNMIDFSGTIVIGEGQRDNAPMFFLNEKVGKLTSAETSFDIAVDPLEGTSVCSKFSYGAMCVIALAPEGTLLAAPDVYMEKIIVKHRALSDKISLSNSVRENVQAVADFKQCDIKEILVCLLDRERHNAIAEDLRSYGVKVKLIPACDVPASLSVILSDEVDIYMGIGGAPEGVLSACALQALDGYMEAKLLFNDANEKRQAVSLGIKNLNKIYSLDELVRTNEAVFLASGVTDSSVLKGIRKIDQRLNVRSIIIEKNKVQRVSSDFYFK